MENSYKVINGTSYNTKTSHKIIAVLETCKANKTRITLDYGDVNTGKSWGEVYDISGCIGRSTGKNKVPLLLHNVRSIGGSAILTHCIIGIKESKGGKILYSYKK